MIKRLLSAFCAAALLFGMFYFVSASGSVGVTVYQTALNDLLIPLQASTMPVSVGGVIYVPYTVFDRSKSSVDLGVYYQEVKITSNAYTFSLNAQNNEKAVTFDVNMNTCKDKQDNALSMRAVIRNGKAYVPARAVCEYFGLQYALLNSDFGYVVRITTGREAYDNNTFLVVARPYMQTQYNNYITSLSGESSTGGDSASTAAPATTAPSSAPAQASRQPTESEPGEEETGEDVSLAFLCGDGTALDDILDTLQQANACALFLFPTDTLTECADQIRRVARAGHIVGLSVPMGETANAAEVLREGNETLEKIACLRAHTAYLSGGTGNLDNGWYLWTGNVDAANVNASTGLALYQSIWQSVQQKKSAVSILMSENTRSADALKRLMNTLGSKEYQIVIPAETVW
ncbi:MAG: hypothetical protein LUG13_00470 [Oscillospiraceae bacterium]|nr:hypothetical protein [Oscillospiraceae bacterium]